MKLDDYPVTGDIDGHVGPPEGQTIEDSFWDFHEDNPHIYDELVRLTRQLVDRGHTRVGIKMLFEVLRWQYALRTSREDGDFKLNNNYHSYYARLIMRENRDLRGVFETRRLHPRSPR